MREFISPPIIAIAQDDGDGAKNSGGHRQAAQRSGRPQDAGMAHVDAQSRAGTAGVATG